MTSLSTLAQEQISRLHRQCIDECPAVVRILELAFETGVPLRAGVSSAATVRSCRIASIGADHLSLTSTDFLPVQGRQYYFTLALEGDDYFFGTVLRGVSGTILEFDLPAALYRVERREAPRVQPSALGLDPKPRILLDPPPQVRLQDVSRGGLGLEVVGYVQGELPREFQIELATHSGQCTRLYAEIKNVRTGTRSARLGLSVSAVPNSARAVSESGHSMFNRGAGWYRVALAGQAAAAGADRVWRRVNFRSTSKPRVVKFRNQLDQEIVGLINSTGDRPGAPAVVIPPAWGKTKETLLPLALTIVETCMHSGLPITVLRFDGTNRRGESYIDPECTSPGDEYLHFRFSQAVQDIKAAIRFLRSDASFRAPSCVIISFSLSAVEARRAVAEAVAGELVGWIPVVGMVDLQSGLRSVSGGVDYAEGILKGIEFGRHELVSVLADMDFTGRDALAADLVFKEDARRDMARIEVPITWVHGEHDGWIDPERVKEVLAAGTASNRRFVEVPTGHQLRSSREALQTFRFVAGETVKMAWKRQVVPRCPPLRAIDRVREAEARRRKQPPKAELRSFWADYLLGRQRVLGMELLTSTSTYRDLMRHQVEALRIGRFTTVLDLGSGTGGFLRELRELSVRPRHVLLMDLVPGALRRSRADYTVGAAISFVQVDFDECSAVPCRTASVDAALASLLLSYVKDPSALLAELHRVLRAGGRIAVSSLRQDADISSIYSEGVAELVAAGADDVMVTEGLSFSEVQRSFLNEAARLLELEEQGFFHFYDEDELAALVSNAGFRVLSTTKGLGTPPQATVVLAERIG